MGYGFETYAAVHHFNGILLGNLKRVHSLEVSVGAYCRISHSHGCEFHRLILAVHDLAGNPDIVAESEHRQRNGQYQK